MSFFNMSGAFASGLAGFAQRDMELRDKRRQDALDVAKSTLNARAELGLQKKREMEESLRGTVNKGKTLLDYGFTQQQVGVLVSQGKVDDVFDAIKDTDPSQIDPNLIVTVSEEKPIDVPFETYLRQIQIGTPTGMTDLGRELVKPKTSEQPQTALGRLSQALDSTESSRKAVREYAENFETSLGVPISELSAYAFDGFERQREAGQVNLSTLVTEEADRIEFKDAQKFVRDDLIVSFGVEGSFTPTAGGESVFEFKDRAQQRDQIMALNTVATRAANEVARRSKDPNVSFGDALAEVQEELRNPESLEVAQRYGLDKLAEVSKRPLNLGNDTQPPPPAGTIGTEEEIEIPPQNKAISEGIRSGEITTEAQLNQALRSAVNLDARVIRDLKSQSGGDEQKYIELVNEYLNRGSVTPAPSTETSVGEQQVEGTQQTTRSGRGRMPAPSGNQEEQDTAPPTTTQTDSTVNPRSQELRDALSRDLGSLFGFSQTTEEPQQQQQQQQQAQQQEEEEQPQELQNVQIVDQRVNPTSGEVEYTLSVGGEDMLPVTADQLRREGLEVTPDNRVRRLPLDQQSIFDDEEVASLATQLSQVALDSGIEVSEGNRTAIKEFIVRKAGAILRAEKDQFAGTSEEYARALGKSIDEVIDAMIAGKINTNVNT